MEQLNFFLKFKEKTEQYWAAHPISGFQGPHGSYWNPGLSENEIMEYEKFLGASFPKDFVTMLTVMNGTTTPISNTWKDKKIRAGVYSYPRDIKIVNWYIDVLKPDMEGIIKSLLFEGYCLQPESKLLPIFMHRYLVCEEDENTSTVLSIMGTDAIVYGKSLPEYLEKEFLPKNLRS